MKRMTMSRPLAVIVIIILTPVMPWWLFAIVAIGYCYRFTGYELIVLGVLIDAYYGHAFTIPVYTLIAILAVFSTQYARPFLSV